MEGLDSRSTECVACCADFPLTAMSGFVRFPTPFYGLGKLDGAQLRAADFPFFMDSINIRLATSQLFSPATYPGPMPWCLAMTQAP